MKILNNLTKRFKKRSNTTAFYELSSREKKRIIDLAARRATEMQLALLREYDLKFGK